MNITPANKRKGSTSRLCCVALTVLVSSQAALADGGSNSSTARSSTASDANAGGGAQEEVFAQPDAGLVSLATVAPGIYSWFNDGTVFGLPGSQIGNFSQRTHLTNDWGGLRSELAEKGVFLNLYNTTAYQYTSLGLNSGGAFISNTQLSLDLDTGRLGWWSGGLIHVAAEARYGSDNSKVFGAGTLVPTYYGAVLPQPSMDNDIILSNLFIEQAFGKFGLIVGVIPGLYVPDRTLFGDDWKNFFGNYAFNENPLFTQFYNPQTTTVTASYTPTEQLTLSLGVYDANTDTTNITKDFFSEINIYGQATYNYAAFGLPGQVLVGGLWSNQDKLDLKNPLKISNVGSTSTVSGNFKNSSWFAVANFSQYLHVITEPEERKALLARGEPLRGVGLFGRIGYSPEDTTAITQHYSLAAFARGLLDIRPGDTIGLGAYVNRLSDDLKNGINRFSSGAIAVDDEIGVEAFYDLALTPALSVNASYQHVWNPFQSALDNGEDSADIFMFRVSSTW